jgi:hypothetical protein
MVQLFIFIFNLVPQPFFHVVLSGTTTQGWVCCLLETSKNSKHILQGFVKISNHNCQGSLWKFLKAFNHISQGYAQKISKSL